MVLTAIPTAIHGRLGVFAGVHCRTDSLRVRISGHRPTAADASPVTYKQGVSSSSLLAPTVIGHLTSSSTGIPFEPAEPVAWLGVPPYHPTTDVYPVWSAVLAA